jgi:Tol biopolymer transport system component/predicted Ser/Thr protein kinase
MSLDRGTKLGAYEILELLGAGGMGEVYRARDWRLKRDVAVKVLPVAFANEPERLARFAREAEVLASLNHPNIAAIYGVEEGALVMELVEGETLAEVIRRGAVPLDTALEYAGQIAAALDAAHEKGIVHRDLKPANVKITPEGRIKVLDFGLASVVQGPAPAGIADASNSPTLTMRATQAGVVLGTAAYMAPEQARGRTVDRRADIWAFGVILWEMLTGRRAFTGEDITEILASVVKDTPDVSGLPQKVRPLLERCLEKDLQKRLRDIGDAMALIDSKPGAESARWPASSRLVWPLAAAVAVAAVALAAISLVHFREKPPAPEVVRFQIPVPRFGSNLSRTCVSPDGRLIAFPATGRNGHNVVWVRALDSLESRPLPGTEDVIPPMIWSPDSRFLGLCLSGKLKKVEVAGGPPQPLCDMADLWRGGAWSREGVIVFSAGSFSQGLMRVSETGGVPSLLTKLDSARREAFHGGVSFLPDGRHFLYSRSSSVERGIYIGSLDAKPEEQSTKRLLTTRTEAVYAPSPDWAGVNSGMGHLLFVREGTLMAQPFDSRRQELSGEAVPIAENLSDTLAQRFSVSTTGVLTYQTGGTGMTTRLTWFDRTGKPLGTVGEPGPYNTVALSPDGTRVAYSRVGAQPGYTSLPNHDLWVHEFARNTSTKLTFEPSVTWMAVWSADGSRIIFASDRDGASNLYQKASSGAGKEELVLKSELPTYPYDWSTDGRFLLYVAVGTGLRGSLWYLPLTGDDRKPVRYLQGDANESHARFSPDGRFVAYTSNVAGVSDVYVQPFPEASRGKWKIGGGSQPRWRRDGRELFYISGDSKVMAVDVTTTPAFKAGTPKALFAAVIWAGARFVDRYDVTADGKRFLINTLPAETDPTASAPITVVMNWEAGLKK